VCVCVCVEVYLFSHLRSGRNHIVLLVGEFVRQRLWSFKMSAVLQCVAVCCSMLQCVAVFCSVLAYMVYMSVCVYMYYIGVYGLHECVGIYVLCCL